MIGAGIAGIATAYYLCTRYKKASVLLVDSRPAMSFTSAQSGDNYRNWWPHPVMTAFTDHSIDLMEQIASKTSNVFNMTRRGYVLATRRQEIDDIIAGLQAGYRGSDPDSIRMHDAASALSYISAESGDWKSAPAGAICAAWIVDRDLPDYASQLSLTRYADKALMDELSNAPSRGVL